MTITRFLKKKLKENWIWVEIPTEGTKVSELMLRYMVDNGNGTGYYKNDDGVVWKTKLN